MNRNNLFVISMLCLTGCPNNPDDTGDGNGKAFITVFASVLDEDITTTVELVGTETFTGSTGSLIEVKPGSYDTLVGDGPDTVDGLPTVQSGGVDWVAKASTEAVAEDDEVTVERPLNRYFSDKFDCERDDYGYDSQASDLKGAYDDTYQLDKQDIDVQEGYKVNPHDDPGMGVIEQEDYMEVESDHLILQTGGDDRRFITESAIALQEFSATVVNTQFGYVSDLRCWVVE